MSVGSDRNYSTPKISIITPSYNQGEFLEETILSVINQNYPNLEYIIIDGGSTDDSIEIIKKYEKHIDYWTSEPDRGQSHAINKGFAKATGEWGNWINSDDMLAEGALLQIAPYLKNQTRKKLFIGQCIITDKDGVDKKISSSSIRNFDELLDIRGNWRNGNSIAQQSVLFPLDAFQKIGGLNEKNHYSMDYELWGDLMLCGCSVEYIDFPVGIFRHYEGQKISDQVATTRALLKAARTLVKRNDDWEPLKKLSVMARLNTYDFRYRYGQFRSRIGIKRRLQQLQNDWN